MFLSVFGLVRFCRLQQLWMNLGIWCILGVHSTVLSHRSYRSSIYFTYRCGDSPLSCPSCGEASLGETSQRGPWCILVPQVGHCHCLTQKVAGSLGPFMLHGLQWNIFFPLLFPKTWNLCDPSSRSGRKLLWQRSLTAVTQLSWCLVWRGNSFEHLSESQPDKAVGQKRFMTKFSI